MRKIIISYHLIVSIISIILSLIALMDTSFENIYVFIVILINLGCVYFAVKSLKNFYNRKQSNVLYFIFYNFIQILVLSNSLFIYKALFGIQLEVSLQRLGSQADLVSQLNFSLISSMFYCNINHTDEVFYIGINITQLVLFGYFLRLYLLKKKSEYN